ncbi:MAG: hypothetical protein JWM42_2137 [Burkholderia sp.]|jgi:hypothetical protein|nr:hypothetical protein [Burkholderia sp.]
MNTIGKSGYTPGSLNQNTPIEKTPHQKTPNELPPGTEHSLTTNPGSKAPSHMVPTASTSKLLFARGSTVRGLPAKPDVDTQTKARDKYGWSSDGSEQHFLSGPGRVRFHKRSNPSENGEPAASANNVQNRGDVALTEFTMYAVFRLINNNKNGKIDASLIEPLRNELRSNPNFNDHRKQFVEADRFLVNLKGNDGLRSIVNAVGSDFR